MIIRAGFSLIILLIMLLGCHSADKKNFSMVKSDFHKQSGPGLRENNLNLIKTTLTNIKADLIKLKDRYPQLTNIDDAVITDSSIDYIYNVKRSTSKAKPDTIYENGCYIIFSVEYPYTMEEMERIPWDGRLIEIKNGHQLGFWELIQAEKNDRGKNFSNKIDEIFSNRLTTLIEELKKSQD